MMNKHVAQIVDELYELGIEDVVLSPGARSTPLSILFCEHKFNVYMDIDERSAAFFALGMAKAKNKAVVLVCTSGSACGHYLPALMEAKHSKVPLIILTADRPPELQNVGAPQTINQNNLFGNFTKYYEELSIDSDLHVRNPSYTRLVMQKAYVQAHTNPCAAVHVNVPLREPLVPKFDELNFSLGRAKLPFSFLSGTVENKAFIDYFLENYLGKRGIIICGPAKVQSQKQYYTDVLALSNVLQVPLLADPLSQFRAHAHANIITNYDVFLKQSEALQGLKADYILLVGQSPVSKSLFQFLQSHTEADIFQLNQCTEYLNPALNTSKIIQISEWNFAKAILQYDLTQTVQSDELYLEKWQCWQQRTDLSLVQARHSDIMFEGSIIFEIQDNISTYIENNPQVSLQVVIANSMAIRHMDHFWQAKQQPIKFYGNRGVNGIDGTISTALGIAASASKSCTQAKQLDKIKTSTVLITGDLALFHDLSGLLLGMTHDLSLTIVLLNNNGGGIFQYLPQAQVDNFEYLFLTPHNLDFSALTQLYGLSHMKVDTFSKFNEVFSKALCSKGINIIEIPIDMQASKNLHAKCQHLV